jgi:hypothetical protein
VRDELRREPLDVLVGAARDFVRVLLRPFVQADVLAGASEIDGLDGQTGMRLGRHSESAKQGQ